MGSSYCPKCGSHEVEFEEDGIVECMNCGFQGKDFPSEHLLIEGEDDDEELPIKKKPVVKAKVTKAKPAKKAAKPKAKAKKGKKK